MIIWKLDEQEADYIMKALMQKPWGEVNPLIVKMMEQANAIAKDPGLPVGNHPLHPVA